MWIALTNQPIAEKSVGPEGVATKLYRRIPPCPMDSLEVVACLLY